ncbi:hypothetical protein DMH18_37700 [Streptomyces sp. WAC 06783]|uniref:hypothetical protein n=1 Tax=Streptomyces sp. WAC 06783 TaxID=2203211 RepID=UPI000F744F23|nr:hypothetical protein [Streptomyces sp. WAC 06783]RSO03350.1 hypothetical protein DMH18_37700 [Streptomyces sp. WAC 06783]
MKISMSIRVAAAATMAGVALGVTAPLASATEAKHQREAATTQAAQQFQRDTGVPEIQTDGLDDRLAELPENRTMEQVVEAMYPGDKQAQAVTLQVLRGEEPVQAGAATKGFWGTAWKYTKCVAAVGAAFIPATKAYKAIKGLGGVKEAAKLLVGAGNVKDFKKAAGNAALDILGISAIQTNCF